MLAPLKLNKTRVATSVSRWIEAPIKGWNAKSDLSDMEQDEAVVLDNLIVVERGLKLRPGHAAHVTGLGGRIAALMEYAGIDATAKLFASTETAIYDVSSMGAVGAAVVTGINAGQWQHSMFSTAGGNFLVLANGLDSVRNYDGTTWTTPAITGVTSATLITVTPHMSRLWFVQKNTMKVWYLPANAIAGAATAIDFGPLSRMGGYLMAMASWTRDGGAGLDDIAVFITSKGEVHVFSGTDPASAATWERVGTFKIAEPIGRRCFVKSGSDVGILTSQGLVPLSNVLPISLSETNRVAATEKIGGAFQTAYEGGKNLRGWQCIEYPKQALVIVNVPVIESNTIHQYVVSATKGAWSRWTGLTSECWSLMGDRMFFGGSDGTVYELTGSADVGAAVNGVLVQAFTELGTAKSKTFKRMRPQFYGPIGYRPQVGLRLDYDDTDLIFGAATYDSPGPAWDVATWDVDFWAADDLSNSWWQGVVGKGFAVAVVVRISSTETITYNGSRLLYELGGPV